MDVTDAPIVRETGAPLRLAKAAGAATVVLTGTAFWLSYEHLHDVARRYGLDGARAWAWPATVDLFIAIGEALILRSTLRRAGVDRMAVTLTIVGSAGSVVLNVAGVGPSAPAMTYVVAAVPPIAALLAFGALMRQLYGVLAVMAAPATDGHGATGEVVASGAIDKRPATAGRGVAPSVSNETAVASAAPVAPRRRAAGVSLTKAPRPTVDLAKGGERSADESAADKRAQEAADRRRARELIEGLYAVHGRRPRDSEMTAVLKGAGLPCSRQYAGARRKEIEKVKPALAALGQKNVRALGQPPPAEHRQAL
jgi:hypothetical protein